MFILALIYLLLKEDDTQSASHSHSYDTQMHSFPSSAGKAKAGMVHSVSGWTLDVQVKLWDPLRTRATPERLSGVFTTRHYTNPRLPYLISLL